METFIEIVGAVIGITYLYLEYKASFWLWSVGIVMSLFYIFIFYHSKFYADAGIYLYYLGANVYGLMIWYHHRKNKNTVSQSSEMPITHLDVRKIFPLTLITMALWVALYFLLSKVTDSPVPLGDSFTTALSVVAMYMLAKKNIEHWFLWIVVNFVSAALYVSKGLYPTSVLFFIYGVVSCFAYRRWKKQM